jgi:hypothetical protein
MIWLQSLGWFGRSGKGKVEVTFKGSSSGCRNSSQRTVRVYMADGPRGAWQPKCSSCSSRVLACLSFDTFCRWIFVARSSHTVRTWVPDGPWRGGWSAGPSWTVCYWGCNTGGSRSIFGQSAAAPRTVRLVQCKGAKSFAPWVDYVTLANLCGNPWLWIWGIGRVLSLGKNFYRLPFTPPASLVPNRSITNTMCKWELTLGLDLWRWREEYLHFDTIITEGS